MLKKSVVIRARKPVMKIDGTVYKNIVFVSFLVCGIIFGVMLSQKGNSDWNNFFCVLISNCLKERIDSSIFTNFIKTFIPIFLILLYDYTLGLCGIGEVFLYFTPISFGVYVGICISQYYDVFSLEGLVYWAIVNVPCYAIAAATLIKCCCCSMGMSSNIFKILLKNKHEANDISLKEYTIKYLIMVLPIALGSLLSAVCFKLFANLFSFI